MRSEFADSILANARRFAGTEITRCGITVDVAENVYPTGELSEAILECLDRQDIGIRGGESVLDYGCGTGFLAIAAAKRGAGHVLAVDINPAAITCATKNAEKNAVSSLVEARLSDGFGSIEVARKFDLILAGMPFESGHVRSALEYAVYDPEFKMRKDLFRNAYNQLSPGGRIFTSYSERVQAVAPIEGFDTRYFCEVVAERVIKGEHNFIFMLQLKERA